MDLNDIRELYVYNRWANHRSLAAAAKLDNATFIRPMANRFSSVRDTLAHILSGEWIWLERWNGISPTALLDAAAFPTVESLKVRWETVEQGYHEFLHSLSLARLQKNLAYINRAGQPYEYPLWQQMVHVVNHSSYHRGQVTTLLRQLGAQPIATDFLEYYDEKNA